MHSTHKLSCKCFSTTMCLVVLLRTCCPAGTFIAGRLARMHKERVRSLCLIDPVCFGMFMPQLLSNFLYSTPPWRGLHQ